MVEKFNTALCKSDCYIQTQVLTNLDSDDVGSPTLDRKNRRESLIITDFPSAVERPSLPVTPAPIRRPTFWGGERNDQAVIVFGVSSNFLWSVEMGVSASLFSWMC